MDEKITQEVVDTILEKGVDFTISIRKLNLLHKIGILPTEKKFTIHPISLGALVQISKIASRIDSEQLEKLKDVKGGGFLQKGFGIVIKHKDDMLLMVAYGIRNQKGEPSERFIQFLDDNLTSKELLKLVILVIRQMDVTDFLASMVSITGVSLIETKKKKITSGKLSEE